MNQWLLLLMVPLGMMALTQVFDDDDDDDDRRPEPEPEPEPEPDDDDDELQALNLDGVLDGGAGDDRITSVRDIPGAHFRNDVWAFQQEDGSYRGWNPENPIPPGGLIPGMTALLGGEGDDSITATGPSTHIDGGEGDDVLTLHSEGFEALRPADFGSAVRGGAGDDIITVTGSRAHINGGEGDDSLTVSGERMLVDGGEGADLIDVTGLRDSTILFGRGDTLVGRAENDRSLTIQLGEDVVFTGNATDEYYVAYGDSRIDGGGGNDTLTTYEFRTGSATLLGGAGDDVIIGNDDDEAYSFHSTYFHWNTGDSNDVLDGGAGNDHIYFDLSDTVTGGTGGDILRGWVQMGQTAVVTDLTPAEDLLFVHLEPQESTLGEDAFGHVAVVEENGDTLVRVQGQDVLRIEGATGLRIGYDVGDIFDPVYVDSDGNPADAADLDLILDRFEDVHL